MTEIATAAPPPPPPPSATIDFARPFRFVFEDPNWLNKILVGGLFYLASILLIGLPFVWGYLVRLVRNVIRGDARPLPEWDNVGEYFVDGLKIFLIGFVYTLPLAVFWGLVMFSMMIAGGFENEPMEGPAGCLFAISMMFFIILIFAYSILLPAPLLIFAATGSVGEAFNLSRVFRFIWNNPANYLLAFLVHLVANFLSQFGVVLLCVGVFFVGFWGLTAAAYAFAEAWRLAKVR